MNEPAFEAWNVSEDKFPRDGSNVDKLTFLLKYAILSPSSHNTQPWLFRIVNNNIIEVYADRTRALPVVDPEDRALIISCGTALCYLQIALRHFGYKHNVDLLPKSEDQDLLARISIDWTSSSNKGKSVSIKEEQDSSVFQAITKRRTNRLKFEDEEVESSILTKLQSTIAEHGDGNTWLHIANDDQKSLLAHLIAEGDRIQMSDKRFRRELASWIHSNRSRNKDGMPGYAFGINDVMSLMGPFVLRTFDSGRGQAAKDRQLAAGSPVLAVLGTNSDEPIDWLKTGLALGYMLRT